MANLTGCRSKGSCSLNLILIEEREVKTMKQTKINPIRDFFLEYYGAMETHGFCWFEDYFKNKSVKGRYMEPSQARDVLPNIISGEVYLLDVTREAVWKMIGRVDGIYEVKGGGHYCDQKDFDPRAFAPSDEDVNFMYPPLAAIRLGDHLAIVGSE